MKSRIFGICLGILLLVFFLNSFDLTKAIEIISQYINFKSITVSLIIIFSSFLVRAWRWKVLMFSNFFDSKDHNQLIIYEYLYSICLNTLSGLRFGDFYRIRSSSQYFASKAYSRVISLFFIEKGFDLIFLFFCLFLVLFSIWYFQSAYLISAIKWSQDFFSQDLIYIFLLIILLLSLFSFLLRKFNSLSFVKVLKETFFGSLQIRTSSKVLFLTLLTWLLELMLFIYIATIFDINPYAALLAFSLTALSTGLPQAPAHVGTTHFVILSSLALFEVDSTISGAFAIACHSLLILPVIIFLFVDLLIKGFKN